MSSGGHLRQEGEGTRGSGGRNRENMKGRGMNLNSIMIGSEDPKRLTEYYTRLFGEPAWSEGGFAGWKIGSGWIAVGAHDQVKGGNAQPGRLMWNIETPDVQAEFARLKSAGATIVREPYSPGGGDEGSIATLSDPDNNYFQLMSPM
jgi:predicted enzyme related to lactoylglutathione lyase